MKPRGISSGIRCCESWCKDVKNLDLQSSEVRLRGGFADRHGIAPENALMQINDLDERSRVALINTLSNFWQALHAEHTKRGSKTKKWDDFLRSILSNVYVRVLDFSRRPDNEEILRILHNTILRENYALVFSMLEYVAKELQELFDAVISNNGGIIYEVLNGVFERELVGYRFVDSLITPITDEIEMYEITQALTVADTNAREHLRKAVQLLSDRDTPDYANSIKESISAIEALCANITGSSGKESTLGNTLQHLSDAGVAIHPALQRAFSNLYGYTSDAAGIRHAGQIDGENATFVEAKFMLVACSAFVNYLLELKANSV